MRDCVFLENIVVTCKVGISKKEGSKKQRIVLDIRIFTDLKKAASSGNIDGTISYSSVYNDIVELVRNKEYILLESVAEDVAKNILTKYSVEEVNVKVSKARHKPRIIGIEISRRKNG